MLSTQKTPVQKVTFLLRKAEEDDLLFARELIRTNMAYYYQVTGFTWDDDLFNETWNLTFNTIITLPELQAEKRIGVVRLHIGQQQAILWDFHLLPQYQNQGMGEQILQRCIKASRDLGCNVMVLNVCKVNPALSLYLRAGFTPSLETDHELQMKLLLS